MAEAVEQTSKDTLSHVFFQVSFLVCTWKLLLPQEHSGPALLVACCLSEAVCT